MEINMKYVLDAVLILVLIVGIFLGYRRGFVRTVGRPVKCFATLFCSFRFCSLFSERVLRPLISEPVTRQVAEYIRKHCGEVTAENAGETLPTVLKLAAGLFGIDVSEATSRGENVVDSLTSTLTAPVVDIVSTVLSFVALLILCTLIFTVVLWLIDLLFRIGPVSIVNKVVGVLFSGAFALLISWAIASLFAFALDTSLFDGVAWAENFEGGFFYRFLNQYNPLDLILSF